ncbi:hypothetical protein G7Y89_g15007 [Cudoniella acicularis]|uniref:DUF7702 domain-containing protein n=1 Tax=Cudoniella acicularis TaxID=354080 RepID=A0A8H4VPX5_9HELO|nr:hypothetical protein G7Y89_g15007 [Cudoniella acicularis]
MSNSYTSSHDINIATIPVYAILLQPILYCAWKHGAAGLLGWLILNMFCSVRIIGSILSLHAEATNDSGSLPIIISNIGLSPLILGLAGVLHEARTSRNPNMNTRIERIKVIVYHLTVSSMMVFVIIGVIQQINDKESAANTLMKIGVIGLLSCVVVLGVWTWLSFQQPKQNPLAYPAWDDATKLLHTVFRVLPLLLIRVMYSLLATFIDDEGFKDNMGIRIGMSVVPEMLLVTFLALGGVMTRNIASLKKMEKKLDESSESDTYQLIQPPAVTAYSGAGVERSEQPNSLPVHPYRPYGEQ